MKLISPSRTTLRLVMILPTGFEMSGVFDFKSYGQIGADNSRSQETQVCCRWLIPTVCCHRRCQTWAHIPSDKAVLKSDFSFKGPPIATSIKLGVDCTIWNAIDLACLRSPPVRRDEYKRNMTRSANISQGQSYSKSRTEEDQILPLVASNLRVIKVRAYLAACSWFCIWPNPE